MASRVYVKNPNGTIYVYENISYWDKEEKKTPSKQQDFFSRWAELNHDGGFFALDITSVSSYSEMTDFVRLGYNRDGDDLPL